MKLTRTLYTSIFAASLVAGTGWAQTTPTQSTPSQSTPSPSTSGSSGQTGTAGRNSPGQSGMAGKSTSSSGGAQSSASQQTGHTGHVAGAAGTAGEGESTVGKADQTFMTKAAQGGMAEVQLAQMAQQKGASEEVKNYARKLEQDHTKANDQLKKIAQERGVSLPSDIGPHQQMVQRLSGLSGEEFDRAYIRMQVQDHKKDIKEFQREANGGMDSSVKDFASAQVPVLQEHLRLAEQLSSSTGTRGRKAETGTTNEKSTTKPSKSTSDKSTSDNTSSSGSSTTRQSQKQ